MTDSRLAGDLVEVLDVGSPQVRLAGDLVEVLDVGSPQVRLAGLLVEVLVPTVVTGFVGWGLPI